MTFFSASYQDARRKFKQTAKAVGGTVTTVQLNNGLEVDAAFWGTAGKPALIVTSGLHGIEGLFGSAVQLAAIEKLQQDWVLDIDLNEIRLVFVHAINPYGFENYRRVDENNVDLNRNFLLDKRQYSGSPAAYKKLDPFLNPQSPPSSIEPYRVKAGFNIMRYGVPALKEAIVCGQYQYPNGIFFGGNKASAVTEFVMNHCEDWVSDAALVAHIDLHSGLGEFGDYKILLNEQPGDHDHHWYVESFGEKSLARLHSTDETAYVVSGGMGVWLQNKFSDRKYYFAGAEFGTYSPVRVIGALRAENRAHHYASSESRVYRDAKAELLECFCPASEMWREQVISASTRIIKSAIDGLRRSGNTVGRSVGQ